MRTSSRNCRFSLFRSTAVCPNRGTMTPTRMDEKWEGLTRATNAPDFRVLPVVRMRSISCRRVILAALGYFNDHAAAYFEGSFTTRRFRPFFRRRLSTSRPQRVSIRARNPCFRMRRLFRGRYVGLPISTALQFPPTFQATCKRAKNRALSVVCQRVRCCLQTRDVDFSTGRA